MCDALLVCLRKRLEFLNELVEKLVFIIDASLHAAAAPSMVHLLVFGTSDQVGVDNSTLCLLSVPRSLYAAPSLPKVHIDLEYALLRMGL